MPARRSRCLAGHSAIGTLADLARLARQASETRPIWLLRGNDPAKAYGGGANDKLAARGELGAAFAALIAAKRVDIEAGFRVLHLALNGPHLTIATTANPFDRHVVVDELIVATGFRPIWISFASFASSSIRRSKPDGTGAAD